MCGARMLVTSELGIGMGGLEGVVLVTAAAGGGGMSSAAAIHDMASPSVVSDVVLVVVVVVLLADDGGGGVSVGVSVSGGRGGSGLLEEGGGGTGGVATGVLGADTLLLLPLVVTLAVAPLVSPVSSVDPLDLVDNCLIRVPDNLGSVN